MKAFAIALVMLCGCLELAPPKSGYRVVPPPPAHTMSMAFVLGAWESNFGEVTIDRSPNLAGGEVIGSWTYFNPTLGREVKGRFRGIVRGNVLRLTWTEGASSGHGFLEFSPAGDSYAGQWWTSGRSKTGTWRGWRGSRGEV